MKNGVPDIIKSLADPFHCKHCRRSLQEHNQPAASPSATFDFVTVVLDRSGSMQAVKDKTIAGFNSYLNDQRAAGEALFTLVQFDDVYEVLYEAVPITSVEPRTGVNYQPRGSTALLDAIGRALATTAEKVGQLQPPPRAVLVSVITDGAENASKEFRGAEGAQRIFSMIREYRNRGWQFFFIGAEPNAIEAAVSRYGFARSHVVTYEAAAPDQAFKRLSESNLRARAGDKSGLARLAEPQERSRFREVSKRESEVVAKEATLRNSFLIDIPRSGRMQHPLLGRPQKRQLDSPGESEDG